MSEMMEEEIKRWTARRKSTLALEINLTPAEIESRVEDGKRGMENAPRAKS